jgi:hypothetical protein
MPKPGGIDADGTAHPACGEPPAEEQHQPGELGGVHAVAGGGVDKPLDRAVKL